MLVRTVATAVVGALLMVAAPAMGQASVATPAEATGALTESDLQVIRTELRADKRKVTAEALMLTDAEAVKFWPVYDRYIAELTVINDSKYGLIKEYSEKFGTYTDAQATKFITRWLDVDVRAAKLRSKYVPIVGKVLPGVKSATFFQIDRRLNMLVNLGLASQLPVLQLQTTK